MATLEIENVYSRLSIDDQKAKDILWSALRFREKDYYHNTRYRLNLWDGFCDFFKRENGRFLTGLLPEVKLALKQMKIEYEIIDKRETVEFLQNKIDQTFLNKHLQSGMKPVELRDYQIDYINQSIKNKRGVVFAPTACHRKGQGILMYNGEIKKIEDIVVGDQVMGDDSKSRTVIELHRGRSQMYKINPVRGNSFVVNGEHVLTLESTGQRRNGNRRYKGSLGGVRKDVKVIDWLNWSKTQKHIYKLIKTGVEFENNTILPLDPYLLGILLGDGSIVNGSPSFTNTDDILVDYFKKSADSFGLNIKCYDNNGTRCPSYYSTGRKGLKNPLTKKLREIGVWGCSCDNKFIPQIYLTSSRDDRLRLLAGLIDTDGSVGNRNSYEYPSKSYKLADGVAFLARSLGYYASISEMKKCDQNGTWGLYYRVYISSPNLKEIPCKVYYKKNNSRKMGTNPLRVGFSVEKLEIDDYYGFTLKEDPHYLLDDFTITHNSGKTNIMVALVLLLPVNTPTLILANRTSLVDQNYDEIKMWGVKDVGRFYGKHKDLKTITCATVQSAHLIKSFFPKVKCLIVDEIHEMMSKKPRAVYNACKNASVRIGMSATPFKFGERDKVQKYEVKGYIGPVFMASNTETGRLSIKDLQNRDILAEAECTFYPVTEPKLPYHVYIDAVTDGIANNLVLHEMTRRLVSTLKGRTLIIVERISHGDLLQDIIPGSLWVRGQDTVETRKEIIKKLKESENVVAIATSGIFDVGINVFVHNLVNCASGQAEHKVVQRLGRGLRKASDKDFLRYFDWYFTNNDYLQKHSEKRISILKKEGLPVTVKEFDL